MTRVVNRRKEKGTKYIGRGGQFGNPYPIGGDGDRDEVCDKHKAWLMKWIEHREEIIIRGLSNKWVVEHREELCGEILECFCKPLRCHGDFLATLADRM